MKELRVEQHLREYMRTIIEDMVETAIMRMEKLGIWRMRSNTERYLKS